MSQNPTPPDEIDLVLNEMSRRDTQISVLAANGKQLAVAARAVLFASYITPYRAAYMKAHNLDP